MRCSRSSPVRPEWMRPRGTKGAHCKESLRNRQALARMPGRDVAASTKTLPSITVARRQNALALFQSFAGKALAGGSPPKGLEQAFAASLQISPSMWSQIKSARPIGDKLARQIEHLGGRPRGWLDEARDRGGPSPAEKAFMDL